MKKASMGIMLSALLASMLVIASNSMSFAEPAEPERRVGVKVGDWAEYTVNATFYSDDPEQLEFARIDGRMTYPELESMTITVQNVSGTTITTQNLLHFKNGTEKEVSDVLTDVNASRGGVFISANLSAGDTLFPGYHQWINETISHEYLEELREINHVNMTLIEAPGCTSIYCSNQIYFNRATGIFVEIASISNIVKTEGYVTNGSLLIRIRDTNLWGTDNNSGYKGLINVPDLKIIALSLGLALVVLSIVYLRHRKKQN